MDDSTLELSRLKGQVEAYQEQLRSITIEVLREQVQRLQKANGAIEKSLLASQTEFGRYQTTVDERLTKAIELFKELRNEVAELRKATSTT